MNKSRIASITVSFSWIFMIIIGTFFLVVAYNIVGKYKANEELMYDIEVKGALRSIFNQFGRTSGIEENSMAPLGNIFRKRSVEITCNDGISLLVLDGEASENDFLRSYPTFMTYIEEGSVGGSYMVVESFRVPFKSTNLLSIVSRKNMVALDANSDIGNALNKKFRRGSYLDLNYEAIDFSSFDIENFRESYVDKKDLQSVVFVTDEGSGFDTDILGELEMESYLVEVEEEDDRYGVITFTNKDLEKSSYTYYDYDESYSLRTAAALSSPEVFNCSYNMIIDSVISSYDFYIEKSRFYSELADGFLDAGVDKSVCEDTMSLNQQKWVYDEFASLLEDVKTHVSSTKFNNVGELNDYITKVEQWQLNHIEDYNCPYIY